MRATVHDLTVEQRDMVLAKLSTFVTLDYVLKTCTPRGNGKTIKTNKPDNRIIAYIWRMARFHNGTDMTMPIVAFFDLGHGIEDLTGIPLCISTIRDNVRPILDYCDRMADALVQATGGDEMRAAKRYAHLLGR